MRRRNDYMKQALKIMSDLPRERSAMVDPEGMGSDLNSSEFGPDILTVQKYGRGLTHDQRYRPASSQSVHDYGAANAVLGADSFLGL